eukprot:2385847-Rhodomonas_salina.1
MMGFEGAEFYLKNWPELEGKTFMDITCRFDEAIPIGIKTVDAEGKSEIVLNPPNDMVIKEGDKMMVLAEDDDSYELNDGAYPVKASNPKSHLKNVKQAPEKMYAASLSLGS